MNSYLTDPRSGRDPRLRRVRNAPRRRLRCRRHAQLLGAEAEALSRLWRSKQLEYTWTRSLMRRYADFSTVTEEALEYALRRSGLEDRRFASLLRSAYTELEPFPDAVGALGELRLRGTRSRSSQTPPRRCSTLAFHTPACASSSPTSSPSTSLACTSRRPRSTVWQPSASGPIPRGSASTRRTPDVAGAYAARLQAVWINRTGSGDEYGLRGSVIELASLSELAATVRDQVVPPTTPMP